MHWLYLITNLTYRYMINTIGTLSACMGYVSNDLCHLFRPLVKIWNKSWFRLMARFVFIRSGRLYNCHMINIMQDIHSTPNQVSLTRSQTDLLHFIKYSCVLKPKSPVVGYLSYMYLSICWPPIRNLIYGEFNSDVKFDLGTMVKVKSTIVSLKSPLGCYSGPSPVFTLQWSCVLPHPPPPLSPRGCIGSGPVF